MPRFAGALRKITPLCCGLIVLCLVINYCHSGWSRNKLIRIFFNDEKYFNNTLEKLLIPRWPGSSGHTKVSDFLVEELKKLGFFTIRNEWFSQIRFTNIVAIMNAEARNHLLLGCHYDSKFLENAKNYVGATDGAVSCALLLNVVKSLREFLHNEMDKRNDIGLSMVFFDGHESFEDVLEDTNPLNGSRRFVEQEFIPLQEIELFIAFNLIGAPNHIYMSHYDNTYILHKRLADIEQDLLKSGELSNCHQLFHKLKAYKDIEDDHYPFLEEGVPVLHVVPHTYPDVWHTEADNLKNLHWPTIRNMNIIITQFVYDYLQNHTEEIDKRFLVNN